MHISYSWKYANRQYYFICHFIYILPCTSKMIANKRRTGTFEILSSLSLCRQFNFLKNILVYFGRSIIIKMFHMPDSQKKKEGKIWRTFFEILILTKTIDWTCERNQVHWFSAITIKLKDMFLSEKNTLMRVEIHVSNFQFFKLKNNFFRESLGIEINCCPDF